jgi:hypothetical protein
MKQLGLGMLQYAQDYDERFYGATGSPVNPFPGVGWAGSIYPYVKSAQVYTCPSDTNRGSGTNVAVSYAFNSFAATTALAQHQYPSVGILFSEISGALTNVTDAQETGSNERSPMEDGHIVIWLEGPTPTLKCCTSGAAIYHTRGAGVLDVFAGRLQDNVEPGPQPTQPRHFNGANYEFIDGHAKWLVATSVRNFTYAYGDVPPIPASGQTVFASDPTGAAYYSAS